jgi:hypothetical protein
VLVYLFVLKREIHKTHVGGIAQLQRNIHSREQSEKKFINQCSWHDKNMLGKESGAEGISRPPRYTSRDRWCRVSAVPITLLIRTYLSR